MLTSITRILSLKKGIFYIQGLWVVSRDRKETFSRVLWKKFNYFYILFVWKMLFYGQNYMCMRHFILDKVSWIQIVWNNLLLCLIRHHCIWCLKTRTVSILKGLPCLYIDKCLYAPIEDNFLKLSAFWSSSPHLLEYYCTNKLSR